MTRLNFGNLFYTVNRLAEAETVLGPAARDLEQLVARAPQEDYRYWLAVSYRRVGVLLEKTSDLAGALAEHRKNQEMFQALAAEHPEVPEYRRNLAESRGWVGNLL